MKTWIAPAFALVFLLTAASVAQAGPRVNVIINSGFNRCAPVTFIQPAPVFVRRPAVIYTQPAICPTYRTPVVIQRAPVIFQPATIITSSATSCVTAPYRAPIVRTPITVSAGPTFGWRR